MPWVESCNATVLWWILASTPYVMSWAKWRLKWFFGALSHISVEPTLQDQIIMAQPSDKGVQIIKENLHQKVENYKCFRQDGKGILWFESRLVVPKSNDLKKKILDEAHLSKLSMHLGSTKTYHDLKPLYWWTRMKREIPNMYQNVTHVRG